MTALLGAADLMGQPADVLLDVQWTLVVRPTPGEQLPGSRAYEQGHLPGAWFADLETVFADPPGDRGRHPLPELRNLQSLLRRAGADLDSRIVVYDGGNSMSAARAWWVLRDAGLTDVSVLDGGLAAWQEAGGEVTSEPPSPTGSSDIDLSRGHLGVLTASQAGRLAQRGKLIDARAPERYRGDEEPIDPVGGHIPGAINLPTSGNLGADQCFLGGTELRSRFADAGVDDDGEVGVYCGSGVTAAHEILALHEAGIEALLYPGSWSEWVLDPSRPVATGPNP